MLVKQQRKYLNVRNCLLLSCLLLLIERQAALATPILPITVTFTTTISSKTSTEAEVVTATRRLRDHERPKGASLRGSRVGGESSSPCEHKSLSELIKTSPVILKALGAHIFNHDDDEDLRILHNSNDALLLKWQNEQNKVLSSLKRTENLYKKFTNSPPKSFLSSSSTKTAEKTRQHQNQQSHKQQQTFSDAATNRAAMLASMNADAILITLTPETIYKGASLLKMTTPNAAEQHATSGSMGGGGSTSSSTAGSSYASSDGTSSGVNSGTINSSEASYLYEGQLNATVQPLSCFDENLLKMLPSDLIIFGKLITIDEQQQQMRQTQQQQQDDDLLIDIHDYTSSSSSAQRHLQQSTKDLLKISINGLHRWSSQFENYIWKHLGWDDWSDFTVCSVACGKGVQQRFRRCLLDNPMVNLNMNFYNADEADDDIDVDVDVDSDIIVEMELEEDTFEEGQDNNNMMLDVDNDWYGSEQLNKFDNMKEPKRTITTSATTLAKDVNRSNHSNDNMLHKADNTITGNILSFITTPRTVIKVDNFTTADNEPEVMRIFEGRYNDTFVEETSPSQTRAGKTVTINNEKSFKAQLSSSSSSAIPLRNKVNRRKLSKQQIQKIKGKKHKSAKLFSTMFCEGYNIEQRNCNSFECSDDINDLLKFYRKFSTTDETNTAATQTMMMDVNTITSASSISTMAGTFSTITNSEIDGTEQNNQNANLLTTPINMGYVGNWHNALNFTIMLTLKVKNDSYTTATIFSIRNSTHNLYLESCNDGLRLYLERDKTTEMLPIKFNLYDYHWHQVAISIQNGDFISIHVDCSWINSFVVSKRLFSLPAAADVEIGRGFNGELQQLLILPEHQERFQCSEKRTSINEVKRYIIDTFIDDYSN